MNTTRSLSTEDVAFQNAFARIYRRRYRANVKHAPAPWAYAVATRYVEMLSRSRRNGWTR
jgi:DNA-directed RNA polymerase specialized sigma24 family protein